MTAAVTGKRWDPYFVDLGDGRGMIYDADEDNRYPQQNSATTAVPPSSPARMAMLKRNGASLREIARVLTEAEHRRKRGARWHPQTVARALQNA